MAAKLNLKNILAISFLVIGVIVSYSIVAQAQGGPEPTEEEIAASGISFPVAELGGCGDKTACKAYCEQPANMPACIEFAEKHSLMSKEEAQIARKFKDKMDAGGPGGCRSPRECEAYCSDVSRIEECMSFAEEHGIDDDNIKEGRKVLAYVRSGGQMPGGCTGKESCESYCSNVDNMEECLQFMEKSGLGPPEKDLSIGQMRTIMGLMQRGESPGGCKSKNECEAYCNNDHFEECIAFAEKAGFMKPEEIEMARKTGGVGPGGCRSPRECEAYCNTPENQESCFNFAKERGLLREEDLNRMKEGIVQLRAGLEQAPPEVAACLKSTMGPNIIEDIEAGRLVPGPAIGEKMRGCFEKFHGGGMSPGGGGPGGGGFTEIFNNAPPEVLSCLKEKFGDKFEEIKSGRAMPTLEMGDTFRVCFESVRFEQGGFGGEGGTGGPGGPGSNMGPPRGIGDFLKNAPPGVASCLKEKLGDKFEKAQSGEFQPTPEFGATIRSCFESFRPQHEGFAPPEGGMMPGGEPPREGGFGAPPSIMPSPGLDFDNLPPAAFECLRRAFGEDVIERLRSGALPATEFAAKAKSCLFEAGGGTAPPPGGGGTVCAQVITPARDPQSGGCKNFPTPCDVPSGWERVPSCDSSPTYAPPPVRGICPAIPTVDQCPPGEERFVAFSSPECGTYYACKPSGSSQTYPSTYPSGQTYPADSGYTPPPEYQQTMDPARECANRGGSWDAASNSCKFPEQTAPSGNILRVFEPVIGFFREFVL